MNALIVVLLLAAGDKEASVTVDEKVKVNGAPVNTSTSAPSGGGDHELSVVTPRTVGQGGNKLEAGVGFPGVHVAYLRGITDMFDLGARFSVNYGWEGQVALVTPGIKIQALLKAKFFDNGKVSIGGSFAPGPLFYFPRFRGTVPGFALPIGLNVGIVASPALNVGIALELPMWIQFGTFSGLALPITMGGGVEYFLSSTLALFFEVKMGPTIWTNGTAAAFTFDGKLGVGWRF